MPNAQSHANHWLLRPMDAGELKPDYISLALSHASLPGLTTPNLRPPGLTWSLSEHCNLEQGHMAVALNPYSDIDQGPYSTPVN